MATQAQLKAARELLDLDVKEVSLVDKPANLRQFLIVKRQAESNLGEFEIESSVVEWLEKMAGTPGAPTESIQALTAVLAGGAPVADKTETVEMCKARHAYEVETHKAGQTEETQEQLEQRHAAELEVVTKNEPAADPPAEPPAAEPPAESKPTEATPETPVAKNDTPPAAEPDPDDQPMIVVKQDGSIHVAGTQVQKAKTFGKSRTAALQNAVSALAKLLGDVSEDSLKAAMAPYMDPSKKVDTTKAAPEAASTADPAELITKAVTTALEPINKRLEEIEKTRNPSQSVEGDGGTDTKTAPVEKSIWAGVL